MCDNYDDGEIVVIILCNVCGNLCIDCDWFFYFYWRIKIY